MPGQTISIVLPQLNKMSLSWLTQHASLESFACVLEPITLYQPVTGGSRSIAGNFPTYPLRLQLIWMSLLRDPMVALVKHTDSCTQRVPMTSKEPLSPRVECWKPATNKNEEINTIYVLSSTNYKCRLIPTNTMFSDHLALASDVFTVPWQYSGKF